MATNDSATHTLEVNDKECVIEDGHFETAEPISMCEYSRRMTKVSKNE